MHRILNKILGLSLLLYFALNSNLANAQLSDRDKCIWIVQNFAPNIEWSGEEEIEKFTIGVYGIETQV